MRLTRFCSIEEYNKFVAGEVLVNNMDHYRDGRGGSTSVGFCFTDEAPRAAWRWLKGIVDFDVCMVLEIDEELLTRSSGKYANYSAPGTCRKVEYCMQIYSNKCAKLVQVLRPEEFATEAEIEAAALIKRYHEILKKVKI